MNLRTELRELGLDAVALVWPTSCVGCGAPDRDCCQECLREVRGPPQVLTPRIGIPCFARAVYAGPTRALLIAFKHGGMVRFGRELGTQFRAPLDAALRYTRAGNGTGNLRAGDLLAGKGGCTPPVIVPAPSRPARTRERGYRHVELLVAHALRGGRCERSRGAQLVRALRTLRGRTGQVGLGPRERERNARLLAVRPRARAALRGRDVVLVDDVLTTGATLLAARDAVEGAGARVIAIAVLCIATDPRSAAL